MASPVPVGSVAMALLFLMSPSFLNLNHTTANPSVSSPSAGQQWGAHYVGMAQGGDSTGTGHTEDSGDILFTVANGSGNGTVKGHLDVHQSDSVPISCTYSGSVDYTWAVTVSVDATSGNLTFGIDPSFPDPNPRYFQVQVVSGDPGCVGGQVLTTLPFSPLPGATASIGYANVKLQDGASWNFTYAVPGLTEKFSGTIHGADAPLNALNVNVDSPTEGITYSNLIVGSFNDTGIPPGPASDYVASVSWGDGSSDSVGAVIPTSNKAVFNVTGSHLYPEAGKFSISVMVSDSDGGGTTIDNSVSVGDADLKAMDGFSFNATAGVGLSGTIGEFLDYNPKAPSSDFKIEIDWGDGTSPSPGVAVSTGGPLSQATFNITGAHTYSSSGTYFVNTTIVDKDSTIETANSTAFVGEVTTTITSSSGRTTTTTGGPGPGPSYSTYIVPGVVGTAVAAALAWAVIRKKIP